MCMSLRLTLSWHTCGRQEGKIRSYDLPDLKHIIRINSDKQPGCMRFADLATGASDADIAAMLSDEKLLNGHDAINIQFTSGTTGFPKGECQQTPTPLCFRRQARDIITVVMVCVV